VRTIWSSEFDALEEVLETQTLPVWKLARGESVSLAFSTNKIEAERFEVSGLVHGTRRNVDIN
jgi:hypothetical protein